MSFRTISDETLHPGEAKHALRRNSVWVGPAKCSYSHVRILPPKEGIVAAFCCSIVSWEVAVVAIRDAVTSPAQNLPAVKNHFFFIHSKA